MQDLSSFFPASFGKKKAAVRKEKAGTQPPPSSSSPSSSSLSAFLPGGFAGKKRRQRQDAEPQVPAKRARREEEEEEEDTQAEESGPEQERERQERAEREEREEKEEETRPSHERQDGDTARVGAGAGAGGREGGEGGEEWCRVPESVAVLAGHEGPVACVAVDVQGNRMASGDGKAEVKLWDLGVMDAAFRSFRAVEVQEGHGVGQLAWDAAGQVLLAGVSLPCVVLLSREGEELARTRQGDRFLRDLRRTRGHVGAVRGLAWAGPHFWTCAADGSVRRWDGQQARQAGMALVARRSKATALAALGQHSVAAAACDGLVRVWDGRSSMRKAVLELHAHQAHSETSGLAVHEHMLGSRGGDHTVQLWDLRTSKRLLCDQQENYSQHTQLAFSPCGSTLLTGTSARPHVGTGRLLAYATRYAEGAGGGRVSSQAVQTVDVSSASVVGLQWHAGLRQVFVASSDCMVRVLHDHRSQRGVLHGLAKGVTRRKEHGLLPAPPIANPHALPMFQEEASGRLARARARRDPVKSRRPDLPIAATAKGHHGQVGVPQKEARVVEDARQALLRHAQEAEANPVFFGDAYARNQPEKLFASSLAEEEEEKRKQAKRMAEMR